MPKNRNELLESLYQHESIGIEERSMVERVVELLLEAPDAFHRTRLAGHMTASAWITDADNTHALLLHHKKLGKWLQPGGHADGNENLAAVALKEAQEETGLHSLVFAEDAPKVFDVDTHEITTRKQTRKQEPAHIHYDVRFHLIADRSETPVKNEESNALLWIPLTEIGNYTAEESVLRMARKTVPLL